jgi:hypothetical protein
MQDDKKVASETPPKAQPVLSPDEVFLNFDAKQNIVGLFNLLLQVDKRNNPEKYTKQVVVEQVIQ